MVDPGRPSYPPERDSWEFAPLRTSTRRRWFAVLGGLIGLALAGGLVAALVVLDPRDAPGFIEDADLVATITAECGLMTSTVESIPLAGPPEQRAATIRDQSRAVELMVASIRRANGAEIVGDQPADRWLRDWTRLVQARDTFARRLRRDPDTKLEIPRDADGVEITARMGDVWRGDPACEVPSVLIDPRSETQSDV